MFKYDFLFGDHFAKASPQAKLLYINLSFYADCGFVSNPRQICKSMGYDEGVIQELIDIDELLTVEGRAEMFITSYFVHNKNFKPLSWLSTAFGEYWKNKMWMKKNGIATLKKQFEPKEPAVDPTLPGSAIPQTTVINDLEEISKLNDDVKF